jgi:hypothetical protein
VGRSPRPSHTAFWGHHIAEQLASPAVDRQLVLHFGDPLAGSDQSAWSVLVMPGIWPLSISCCRGQV